MKLQHELSLAEEKLRKAHSQGKLLESDRKTLDKGIAKANNSIKVCFASTFVFMNPSRNHQGSFTVFLGSTPSLLQHQKAVLKVTDGPQHYLS